MEENRIFIDKFYAAFQQKNFKYMQECYAIDANFNDEAFSNLNGKEAGKMWEMLITRGKDLELKYEILETSENGGKARWIAKYTFSKTKRLVINEIIGDFIIKNGKIIKHTDHFDFYKWARQAFGLIGLFLGWTNYFKSKVQKTAMQSLKKFMEQNS